MSSLKYYILFSLCFFSTLSCFSQLKSKAQQRKEELITAAKSHATVKTDSFANEVIYTEDFKLPPLNVLFENARNNPSIAILEKDKLLQKKLLSKEKKSWLKYFTGQGSYSYGIADVYSNQSNQLTPMLYQYAGSKQNFWNIGGSVSIPLEDVFDLKNKISRQKIEVDKAQLSKEQAYDQLKQQIIHLYVSIQSGIEMLKESSRSIALFKGVSANAEEDFRNRRATIESLAQARERESDAKIKFETTKANVQEQILLLEIISKTVILPNN